MLGKSNFPNSQSHTVFSELICSNWDARKVHALLLVDRSPNSFTVRVPPCKSFAERARILGVSHILHFADCRGTLIGHKLE